MGAGGGILFPNKLLFPNDHFCSPFWELRTRRPDGPRQPHLSMFLGNHPTASIFTAA
jgi:hypothetical protein